LVTVTSVIYKLLLAGFGHHLNIFLRGPNHHVREDLEADVLFAATEPSNICHPCGEWGGPDVASEEKVVHPPAPEGCGHDLFGVGKAIGLGDFEFFLALADLLSV
jgi:hypothetical protein